jgi:hypothetical protein
VATSRIRFIGESRLPLGSLVFGMLGAPIAWLLHLSVSYILVALGCNVGWGGTDAAIVVCTVVFGGLAVAAGLAALRGRRTLEIEAGIIESLDQPQGRSALFMLVGVFASGIFLVLIVLNALGLLFVPTCGPASP